MITSKKDEKFVQKIVVHVGLGRMSQRPHFQEKILPEILRELSLIAGQKPAVRKAKKSIANFKTRTGDIIGAQVTLRKTKMEEFLKKLVNVVLPRVKDFRGLDVKNVDTHGALNIGFREQYVFPEVEIERSQVNFGLQVTIVPRIRNRGQAIDFYSSYGVPLKGLIKKRGKK